MSPNAPSLRPLILASTSRYRASLLERFGLAFDGRSPAVDEVERAGRSAAGAGLPAVEAKAEAVAARHPEAIVIGSDQVPAASDHILDKPGNAANCREQLELLTGSTRRVLSPAARCAASRPGVKLSHVDTTAVKLRPLADAEIERYVEREQPFDCAGGFKAEALGHHAVRAHRHRGPDGAHRPAAHLAGRRAARRRASQCPDSQRWSSRAARRAQSMTAARSAGSGALALNSTPVSGHIEAHAVRVQEHAREPERLHLLVEFLVAVLLVARHRIAACAACTRIWCVRPVSSATSTSVARLPKNCTGLNSLTASLPDACAFTVRSPPTRISVRSGTSMRLWPSSQLPFTSAR